MNIRSISTGLFLILASCLFQAYPSLVKLTSLILEEARVPTRTIGVLLLLVGFSVTLTVLLPFSNSFIVQVR
jgi:hypothetical protein